eukprot:jgi/Mesvir1/5623/Mv15641-RA.1
MALSTRSISRLWPLPIPSPRPVPIPVPVPVPRPRPRTKPRVGIVGSAGSPWDRDVFIVSKGAPHQSILAVCDVEKDRQTHVPRPVTHLLAFNDARLALLMEKVALKDQGEGKGADWCIDDDGVDTFVADKLDAFMASIDSYQTQEDPDVHVQNVRFRELIDWTGISGIVLRLVEIKDDKVVISSYYPREDPKYYIPFIKMCMK